MACARAAAQASAAQHVEHVRGVYELAAAAAADEPGYAKSSYYTTLGLYLFSLPGLYSLVKRSTKAKVVQKTYAVPGPAVTEAEGGKPLDALAREVSTFFIRNNYNITDAGEIVTFTGNIERSRGQAAFQVFCTFIGLGSLALVLSTIDVLGLGDNWYWMTLVSPLAGVYYWENAAQVEEVKVKLVTNDNDSETDIRVQGPVDAVEDFRRALSLNEKGMVYVKGIFED
eukprot:PRCOL_00002489-RA